MKKQYAVATSCPLLPRSSLAHGVRFGSPLVANFRSLLLDIKSKPSVDAPPLKLSRYANIIAHFFGFVKLFIFFIFNKKLDKCNHLIRLPFAVRFLFSRSIMFC